MARLKNSTKTVESNKEQIPDNIVILLDTLSRYEFSDVVRSFFKKNIFVLFWCSLFYFVLWTTIIIDRLAIKCGAGDAEGCFLGAKLPVRGYVWYAKFRWRILQDERYVMSAWTEFKLAILFFILFLGKIIHLIFLSLYWLIIVPIKKLFLIH